MEIYSCKRPSLNVENNAASVAQCNGFLEPHRKERIRLTRIQQGSCVTIYDTAHLFLTTPPQSSNTCTEVPLLKGLNKCFNTLNPGLAPWALQEYRPKGLTARPQQSIPQTIQSNKYTNERNNPFTLPKHI